MAVTPSWRRIRCFGWSRLQRIPLDWKDELGGVGDGWDKNTRTRVEVKAAIHPSFYTISGHRRADRSVIPLSELRIDEILDWNQFDDRVAQIQPCVTFDLSYGRSIGDKASAVSLRLVGFLNTAWARGSTSYERYRGCCGCFVSAMGVHGGLSSPRILHGTLRNRGSILLASKAGCKAKVMHTLWNAPKNRFNSHKDTAF